MRKAMRPVLVVVLAALGFGSGANNLHAGQPTTRAENAAIADCALWALDGYHVGMLGTELLAVRSVTLHVEGQAQAIEPGRFHGVLVLDALNRLEKWDVVYHTSNGDALRAQMRERYGEPASDISESLPAVELDAARMRRTIWLSKPCDTAIIIYERASTPDTSAHTVSAILARSSSLKPGLAEMKTLFH
jgi:hypothetical protein